MDVCRIDAIIQTSMGYTSAADKPTSRSNCTTFYSAIGLYTADDLTPSQLAADMDDNLFANIPNDPCDVLYKLLPNNTEHTNNLRPRRHSLSLTKCYQLQQIHKQTTFERHLLASLHFVHGCVLSTVLLKKWCWWWQSLSSCVNCQAARANVEDEDYYFYTA